MERRIVRRGGALVCAFIGLVLVISAASCKSAKDSAEGEKGSECSGENCAANAPPVDWTNADATYTSYLRVVDLSGRAVEGARVEVGEHYEVTDSDGRVKVGPVSAKTPQAVRVSKDGSTPHASQTTPFKSADKNQEVALVPVGKKSEINPQQRTVIEHQGALVDIPEKGLSAKDGTRPAKASAEVTQLSPEKLPKSALPGASEAYDELRTPAVMGPILNAIYVHFSDASGQELNLAPGQLAMVELPLPGSTKKMDGDSVPFWTLDEKKGTWKKEGRCSVATRKSGAETEQVCRGPVSHFSIWAMAEEVDIYEPDTLGCLNVTTKFAADACYKVTVKSEDLLACDAAGSSCTSANAPKETFLPSLENGSLQYCSVLPAGVTYRVLLTYDVDSSACPKGADSPMGGRRTKLSDPLALNSFQGTLGSVQMINFTLRGDRECGTDLCLQTVFEIGSADLGSPVWADMDGDGFFGASNGEKEVAPGIPADCNDNDADVHPYAFELYCTTIDKNCDGKVPAKISKLTDLSPGEWNSSCSYCIGKDSVQPDKAETKGNPYDEDCDGVIGGYDADQDGVLTDSNPPDCNDYDEGIRPGLPEVGGNFADEDCDGFVLDADGDSFADRDRREMASKLGLDRSIFTDCDDWDTTVNPSMNAADEAGAIVRYFYRRTGETELRRSSNFCDAFYEDGSPTPLLLYHVAKDLNCDDLRTDVDGDGFTAPGDTSLGKDHEGDCNDYDPRIVPTVEQVVVDAGTADGGAEPGTDAGAMATYRVQCEQRNDLANDSVCETKPPNVMPSAQGLGTCPRIRLRRSEIVTTCNETKDVSGKGTGYGVCSFLGWPDSNPLGYNPGTTWGPCDGPAGDPGLKLASCPSATTCGGRSAAELMGMSAWTSAYYDDVRQSNKVEGDLAFQGMCFPSCTVTPDAGM